MLCAPTFSTRAIADNFAGRAPHTHRLEKRIRDLMLPEEFLLNYFETSQQPRHQEQAHCEQCPPSILGELCHKLRTFTQ